MPARGEGIYAQRNHRWYRPPKLRPGIAGSPLVCGPKYGTENVLTAKPGDGTRSNRSFQGPPSPTTLTLATAAHELKTPLAILSGYIELVLGEELGSLNERQQHVLQDAHTSCLRMQRFIRDLFALSLLETGKFSVALERTDINACLSRVYKTWLPRFQARDVAFYFLPAKQLDPFLFDEAKVEHVLCNLLENALKFTPIKGSVWLAADLHTWERRIKITPDIRCDPKQPSGKPDSVLVSVSDTGIGITAEHHLEIFEDFVSIPNRQREKAGMGLGLAIARRLIQAQGGKIWVESQFGEGSKFCFALPLRSLDTKSG